MTDHGKPPFDRIAAAIRRERERAGLSLTELARRSGLAKSTLSQLESGTGNPNLETLWALSMALDVAVSRLIDPPRPPVRLIRAGEGPVAGSDEGGHGGTLRSGRARYAATLLAACPPGARRDLYRVEAAPGAAKVSDPHQPGTAEHLVISAGRALAGPSDEPVELGPGDYLGYPGDVPHLFEALEPGTSGVIIMEHI
ncbi:XRE family transcriptional regulator [Actinomadura sp. ATCC 31491]|uniref:XRE family transcriptional regulator n=1 Tax=Actinomadura luzonensis TaxID=2805427 RepID=A0ABT0G0X4_9ACTN|nr:XRE family transcriptional regulator [Actinomadura luzonensis]MCK2217771.1 XRE family transcriptional regulator [Actinomadura luzonensis]